MVIVRSKEDLAGEQVAEVRKEAGAPQKRFDLSKLEEEWEIARKRAYGLFSTLTIDEDDISDLIATEAKIQSIDAVKDPAVRHLSMLRGLRTEFEASLKQAKSDSETLQNAQPRDKAAQMFSYLLKDSNDGLDRKQVLWHAEGGFLLNLYDSLKDESLRANLPSSAYMLNTLEKWLNCPASTKLVVEYARNLKNLCLALAGQQIGLFEKTISELDDNIECLDAQCDDLVHERKPVAEDRRILIRNCRSPLENLNPDQRREMYKSAKSDPGFKKAFEAYRRAAETTQSEEADALRFEEFNDLFVKYYINGNGNVKRLPTIAELKQENRWLYLLLRVDDAPKTHEDKSPLSLDELFELDGEKPAPKPETPVPLPTPEKPAYRPKGLFAKLKYYLGSLHA